MSPAASRLAPLARRARDGPTVVARTTPLVALPLAALLWAAEAAAENAPDQPKPPARVTATCRDCGVVRSIKEIRTERRSPLSDTYVASPQYLQSRPFDQEPLIGPAISFSWGAKTGPETRVGAVGSAEMQQRLIELSYEITVQFDDGRYGLIEQADPDDLRAGDRVRVVKGRAERYEPR